MRERYLSHEHRQEKRVGEAVVYAGVSLNGLYTAVAWRTNRQIKPEFRCSFRTQKELQSYVDKWFAILEEQSQIKALKKKMQKILHNHPLPFKIGDILFNSWGYEQTNIYFYQVIEVKKRSIIVQEIESKQVKAIGSMSGLVVACKDVFVKDSQPLSKVVQFYDSSQWVRAMCNMKHGKLNLWDGKPLYESSYA